jgi:hypothetical protein
MIIVDSELIRFGNEAIHFADMPALLTAHLAHCPDTPDAEKAAADFVALPSAQRAIEVVHRTCYWGGSNGPRILPMILRQNSGEQIQSSFERAVATFQRGHGVTELAQALSIVNELSYLGQPSFASKMLRMLNPSASGVLDSLVHDASGYTLDRRGYALYSAKLQDIGASLDQHGIVNSRGFASWRAADVDAGIFARIRGWA